MLGRVGFQSHPRVRGVLGQDIDLALYPCGSLRRGGEQGIEFVDLRRSGVDPMVQVGDFVRKPLSFSVSILRVAACLRCTTFVRPASPALAAYPGVAAIDMLKTAARTTEQHARAGDMAVRRVVPVTDRPS